MKLYGIVGAGGSGREVMPLARHALQLRGEKDAELVFVVEENYPILSQVVNGHRVMDMREFLSAPVADKYFNIAIGNTFARERIAKAISGLAQPFTIAAPSHISMDSNEISEGAILSNFTQIASNVKIGRFFHCNYYSSVSHDCVIGDFVTFSPGVRCNGHVIVEDQAFIGAGAIIRDATDKPVIIGKGAIVGMGAVVTKSVPPGITVIGNPAKTLQR